MDKAAQHSACGVKQTHSRVHCLHALPEGDGYPPQLLSMRKPPAIWLRGDLLALQAPVIVTLVGSRAASAEAVHRAHTLGAELAKAGALVVSGGALGIDAAAHRGALQAGGRTCVVLGTGLDVTYPACHARLFQEVQERGLLLSMFPLGTPPARFRFPVRNEAMAALAQVVVVVEAQLGSGSLYTAAFARGLHKQVVAMAGSPGAEACVAKGAALAQSIDEVLALCTGQVLPQAQALALAHTHSIYVNRKARPELPSLLWTTPANPQANLTSDLEVAHDPAFIKLPGDDSADRSDLDPSSCVLSALSGTPQDIGELCARTGLLAGDCAAALVDLELRERCTRLAGGRYIVHPPLS